MRPSASPRQRLLAGDRDQGEQVVFQLHVDGWLVPAKGDAERAGGLIIHDVADQRLEAGGGQVLGREQAAAVRSSLPARLHRRGAKQRDCPLDAQTSFEHRLRGLPG